MNWLYHIRSCPCSKVRDCPWDQSPPPLASKGQSRHTTHKGAASEVQPRNKICLWKALVLGWRPQDHPCPRLVLLPPQWPCRRCCLCPQSHLTLSLEESWLRGGEGTPWESLLKGSGRSWEQERRRGVRY